ncbi:MAG: hypothetical protein KC649_05070 [Candidatus Omnitrophica bacterium]|nr:hypothetical protein [Candidatus Omnitrophota bacterium]
MIQKVWRDEDGMLRVLSDDGEFGAKFEDEIAEVLIAGGNRIVVRLNMVGPKRNRNVICLDQGCELVWQIEDPWEDSENDLDSPFDEIKYEDGSLRAHNASEFWVEIDQESGNINEYD